MKILHTSDWHLGRSLCGANPYAEFQEFLEWLLVLLKEQSFDVLLISGDIFDNGAPSNRAQKMYYEFLCKIARTGCGHVVVIAGNHDSPSFLSAPKKLLESLNVHVVGLVSKNLDDEVIVLRNESQENELIVMAVPYLRDRDIRQAEAGESIDDKNEKLVDGIRTHYAKVWELAQKKQNESKPVPIVGMGHLFAAGGKTVDGDGVRELYVGSLIHLGKDVFPSNVDYMALGHLHVPQKVSGLDNIRYSGSPIPMGFGEAKQTKKVISVEFDNNSMDINEIEVPCFLPLKRIVGNLDEIKAEIKTLKKADKKAWLEIEYTGSEIVGGLTELVKKAIENSKLKVLKIKNKRVALNGQWSIKDEETLDNLDEREVFSRCLDSNGVSQKDRESLTLAFEEILISIREKDLNAE